MNWYKKAQQQQQQQYLWNNDTQDETLYHGTDKDFDNFELGKESINFGMLGSETPVVRHAIFFAKNKDFAREFGKNIKEINPSSLNVFNFNSKESRPIFAEFNNMVKDDWNIEREISDGSFQDWGYFDGVVGEKFVPFLKSKGFNAASFIDTGFEGREDEVIAVFDMSVLNRHL